MSLRILLLAAVFCYTPIAAVFAQGSVVKQGNTIHNQEWGVSVSAPGIELWSDHPHKNSSAHILAATIKDQQCRVNISVMAARMPIGATALDCWKAGSHHPKNLELKKKTSPSLVKIHSATLRPVPHTLYDLVLDNKARQLTNNQLWAYRDREDQCIVLHASSINCDKFGNYANPLMKSIRVDRNKDVTVETVSIGRQQKIASDGAQAHMLAASYYLHRAKPANPGKARRFYQSAYRLTEDKSDIVQMWVIKEGVGISFLMQENSKQALRSLQEARKWADAGGSRRNKMLSSTLYNLACAHSINNTTTEACSQLTELAGVKEPGSLARLLQKIESDPQLANVRNAACYKNVEAALK